MRKLGYISMIKYALLCALGIVCMTLQTAADDRLRLFVEVFPYASVGAGHPADVNKLLKDRFRRLAEQTLSAHPELDRLNKVSVVDKTDPLPASAEALAKYWSASPTTLEILSGTISGNSGNPDVLTSNIYLGDLHGSLRMMTVNVQLLLTPKELRSFRDMHSALMLYALAMDAKAKQGPRGVVSQLLAEAESLLKDIGRSDSAHDPDVEAFSAAVANEIALLTK
jgi:hypothetical protein